MHGVGMCCVRFGYEKSTFFSEKKKHRKRAKLDEQCCVASVFGLSHVQPALAGCPIENHALFRLNVLLISFQHFKKTKLI